MICIGKNKRAIDYLSIKNAIISFEDQIKKSTNHQEILELKAVIRELNNKYLNKTELKQVRIDVG